ncbi:MAG: Lrp/AsnC family transcriptional regulator [Candidatus ainarchaeum sp.]|nr:Lrp/AsnC family transcriptional regulator [Candidatus ainarchaeum sp.]
MYKLDEKDIGILDLLKENAKYSMNKIARKTGIPLATVHHRIKKLEKDEIIKKYTINLNKEKLGRGMVAYILVNVVYPPGKHIDQSALLKKISKNDYVEDASILAGDTDIILKVRIPSIEELNKLLLQELRNTEGVGETKTLISLENIEKL